jgi:hypothetical protein
MTDHDKDFSLSLYNKLWDNINNKDTRLWTFLSIYGAAVALAFGVGKVANLELFTLLVIFVLTLWALFIVANASWWDSRNRIMISGIEAKFPEACKGVIPPFYTGIGSPRMERLNEVSVSVMAGLAFVLYLKSGWPFFRSGTLLTGDTLFPFVLLYLVLGLGVYAWLNRMEDLARSYFETVGSLASVTNAFTANDIKAEEKKDRAKLPWRLRALVFLVGAMVIFDWACIANATSSLWLVVGIAFQIAIIGVYGFLSWKYTFDPGDNLMGYRLRLFPKDEMQGSWKPAKWPVLLLVLYLFSSLAFALSVGLSDGFSFHTIPATSVAEIKAERVKLEDQLSSLRNRTLELEAVHRKKELAEFIKADDAEKRFLRREDAARYLPLDQANKKFATREDLDATQRTLEEARKGFATKEALQSLEQKLTPKKGP